MRPVITLLSLVAVCCYSAHADICEAVRYERVDRVQAYLAADTNAASSVGEKQFTVLHFAAQHSSSNGIKILKMLLAHGAKVDARNHIRQTPLFSAAVYDSAPAAEILLAHGAKVNAQQDGGRTPLHWAALNGYCEVARVLIEHGADIKARTEEGKTPLRLAAEGLESWKKEGDAALIKRYQETVSPAKKWSKKMMVRRPNKTRQPTPGVRLMAYPASAAPRGCAFRSAAARVCLIYQ